MTANRLSATKWETPSEAKSLEDLCDAINAMGHYQRNGREMFINSRPTTGGDRERFLDTRYLAPAKPYWEPSADEMAATQEVIARAAASGITQEQFNELVDRGVVNREVQKVMERARSYETDPC